MTIAHRIALLLALAMAMPPLARAETWLEREYRNFRTYPRLDRAFRLIEAEKYLEARRLLEQVVEIDSARDEAWSALFEVCAQLQDDECLLRHARARFVARPRDAEANYF